MRSMALALALAAAVAGALVPVAKGAVVTNTFTITNGADNDAHALAAEDEYYTANYVECGYSAGSSAPFVFGAFRFTDIPIARSATVYQARLVVQAYTAGTGPSSLSIQAEATSAADSLRVNDWLIVRPVTLAEVAWNVTTAWVMDAVYTSPDIAAVISEVTERSDWNAGGPIAIQLRNTASSGGRQFIHSAEGASQYSASPAKLVIVYEAEQPPPDGIRGENYIPGATNATPTVPLYLNSPSMYYPSASGGLCWASAAASIHGYWDREPHNGIRYWNLFEHGVAPLREPTLPAAPGHGGADVKSVVEWFAHQYYGLERRDEAAIIREFTNDRKGLAFDVTYHTPASTVAAKSNHLAVIRAEIDAGRPISIGSFGDYFGGGHQVPVTGYREMSNTVNSVVYIHRNTGGTQREYANPFASNWGDMDMDRIIPGGTPVDGYETSGNNSAATTLTIDPDHIYNFRQVHNFGVTGDADWVRLNAVAGRRYAISTTGLGPQSDTVLALFFGDGVTEIRNDDNSGLEPRASRLYLNCWNSGPVLIRVTSGALGTHGPQSWYHLEVASETPIYTNRPPALLGIERSASGAGTGMLVRWRSLPDQRYSIHYSTNLRTGFRVLHSNLVAVQEAREFLDGLPPAPMKFYKITADP